MVKLVNGNEVRENMERKDAGLDKIHENYNEYQKD